MNSHPLIIHTVTRNIAFNIHLHPSTLLILICINSINHEASTSIQSFHAQLNISTITGLFGRGLPTKVASSGFQGAAWDSDRTPRLSRWMADTRYIEILENGTLKIPVSTIIHYNMYRLHFHLHILHGVFAVLSHHESVLISVWGLCSSWVSGQCCTQFVMTELRLESMSHELLHLEVFLMGYDLVLKKLSFWNLDT